MSNLQDDAKTYIEAVLGVSAHLEPVGFKVSFNIRDSYKMFELTIPLASNAVVALVLLVPRDEKDYPGIVKLQKHVDLVRKASNRIITYVCRSLTTQDRRSLITHQVNFIQPGFQMFIPELALDLRENFRQRREQGEVAALLPAAQAMLLSCLYGGNTEDTLFTTNALMGDLNYSRMTLSRAVDQLTSLSLICLQVTHFNALWGAARRRAILSLFSCKSSQRIKTRNSPFLVQRNGQGNSDCL